MAEVRTASLVNAATNLEYCNGHVVCVECIPDNDGGLKPCCQHCPTLVIGTSFSHPYPKQWGTTINKAWRRDPLSKTKNKCDTCGHYWSSHFGVKCEECEDERIGGADGSTGGPVPRLGNNIQRLLYNDLPAAHEGGDTWNGIQEAAREILLARHLDSSRTVDQSQSDLDSKFKILMCQVEKRTRPDADLYNEVIEVSLADLSKQGDSFIVAPVPKYSVGHFDSLRMLVFSSAMSLGLFEGPPELFPWIPAETYALKHIFCDDKTCGSILEDAMVECAKYFDNNSRGDWKRITADVSLTPGRLGPPDEVTGMSLQKWQHITAMSRSFCVECTSTYTNLQSIIAHSIVIIDHAVETARRRTSQNWAFRLAIEVLRTLRQQLEELDKQPAIENLVEFLYLERGMPLGEGSYGKVYEAHNGDIKLAVKEVDIGEMRKHSIDTSHLFGAESLGLLYGAENWLIPSLIKPNCIRASWLDMDAMKYYQLMPACNNTLKMFQEQNATKRITEVNDIAYYRIICAFVMWGLTFEVNRLHSNGYVHGDLHARNILLDDTFYVGLVDFGLSYSYVGQPSQRSESSCTSSDEQQSSRYISSTLKADIISIAKLYTDLLANISWKDTKLELESSVIDRWYSSDCTELTGSVDALKAMFIKLLDEFPAVWRGEQYYEKLPPYIKYVLWQNQTVKCREPHCDSSPCEKRTELNK